MSTEKTEKKTRKPREKHGNGRAYSVYLDSDIVNKAKALFKGVPISVILRWSLDGMLSKEGKEIEQ